jgi:hypothetical protein
MFREDGIWASNGKSLDIGIAEGADLCFICFCSKEYFVFNKTGSSDLKVFNLNVSGYSLFAANVYLTLSFPNENEHHGEV